MLTMMGEVLVLGTGNWHMNLLGEEQTTLAHPG
jgi:hypothetical protein